ncbi:MAG: anthranilate synthase component I [Candidatus Bathyarchaeia archaeon]
MLFRPICRRVNKWGITFGQATGQEERIVENRQKPRIETLPYIDNPSTLFERLEPRHNYIYLLESVEGPERLAKHSFLGFNPQQVVSIKEGKARIFNIDSGEEILQETEDPLSIVKRLVQKGHYASSKLRLVGGAVGYISYDAVRYWERLPDHTVDDLKFPDIEMAIFTDGIVFDHVEKQAYYYSQGESRLEDVMRSIQNPPGERVPLRYTTPTLNMSQREFEDSVLRAKEYISSGEAFQVVLSKRYSFNLEGSLIDFYKALRTINPSPYMFYLKMGARQLVGSSPEMLVRVEEDLVETYPIAGTRPKTEDPEKNRLLAEELLSDPKERAEHVMLVDLARNDLGRIAEYGSVQVPEFMHIHQYSHVQHIVSRVVGRLRIDRDCFDAIKAMLPAGTVSGAPKHRAIEIIDELEPTRRGPYAGAVGYFSYNGNSDLAITIRTLTVNQNKAAVQVGAGIVADSDPEKEWFETEQKAAALMKALNEAGERI